VGAELAQRHFEPRIAVARQYREREQVFRAEFELVKLPTCRVRIVGALEVKTLSALEHEAHAAQSAREPATDGLEIGLLQCPEPHEAPWLGVGRQCAQLRRFGGGEVAGVAGSFLSVPVLATARILYIRTRRSLLAVPPTGAPVAPGPETIEESNVLIS